MKKIILPAAVIMVTAVFLIACARGITTQGAANGKAKCGRFIR